MKPAPPVSLIIAGFDTSSGAGLQADLLTFHNHGFHALTAATSLVVETPLEVTALSPVPADFLRAQVSLLLSTYPVATIKIGLLAHPDQALMLAELLKETAVPIVLDPVGIASTGNRLQDSATPDALRDHLAPLVTVLTPNLPEARLLCGNTTAPPGETARALARATSASVLLTGGHHIAEGKVTDLLVTGDSSREFSSPAITTPASVHGTGCVLSSALAAALGRGMDLPSAVASAREYLRKALASAHDFQEKGPPLLALNHFSDPDCEHSRPEVV